MLSHSLLKNDNNGYNQTIVWQSKTNHKWDWAVLAHQLTAMSFIHTIIHAAAGNKQKEKDDFSPHGRTAWSTLYAVIQSMQQTIFEC